MFHSKLTQDGFSIVQGMILAAAVAGMALIGTKLSTDQKQMIKGVESKNRVEQLHQLIYSVVQNRDHCAQTLTLSGLTLPARLTTTTPQEVLAIATAGTGSIANAAFRKVGATYDASAVYMNNSVSINDMSITYPANFANLAKLRITYGRVDSKNMATRTGKGTASADVTKTIDIKVQRNINTGAFESCYASTASENENTIKDFCEDLGSDGNDATPSLFVWNAAYQTCTLQNTSCPTGQIYAGFDANGNRLCNRVQDWVDMNQILDNSSPPDCAGKDIRFEIVGQKVRIKCDGGAPPKICRYITRNYNPRFPVCYDNPNPIVTMDFPTSTTPCNTVADCPVTGVTNLRNIPEGKYQCGDLSVNCPGPFSGPWPGSCDSEYSVGGQAWDEQEAYCADNPCSPVDKYWDYQPWGACVGGVKTRTGSCAGGPLNSCGTDKCTYCNGGGCPNNTVETLPCGSSCPPEPPSSCLPANPCPSTIGDWTLIADHGESSSTWAMGATDLYTKYMVAYNRQLGPAKSNAIGRIRNSCGCAAGNRTCEYEMVIPTGPVPFEPDWDPFCTARAGYVCKY